MSIHIGKEIEKKYKESGMKLSEFAKRLSTSPRNIYDIFERSEIKTDQLQKISEILKFNFFSFYQSKVDEPQANYLKINTSTISVSVVLDGQESTLNKWFEKLAAINKVLN